MILFSRQCPKQVHTPAVEMIKQRIVSWCLSLDTRSMGSLSLYLSSSSSSSSSSFFLLLLLLLLPTTSLACGWCIRSWKMLKHVETIYYTSILLLRFCKGLFVGTFSVLFCFPYLSVSSAFLGDPMISLDIRPSARICCLQKFLRIVITLESALPLHIVQWVQCHMMSHDVSCHFGMFPPCFQHVSSHDLFLPWSALYGQPFQ